METSFYSTATIVVGLALASPAYASVALTGVYDPAGDANDVDQSATFASASGAAGSENVIALGTFQNLVSAASGSGTGGVVSFEEGDTSDPDIVTADGTELGGTLTTTPFGGSTLTFNATTGRSSNIGFGSGSGDRIPTSGDGRLGQAGNSDFLFTNFTFAGAAANTGVVEFGVTLIHRNQNEHVWEGSAIFSDGSTLAFNPVTFPASGDAGSVSNSLDTFFGVQAPAGTTITSVLLDRTSEGGSANTWVDDIGFVTAAVPEPSSAALLGVGAMALVVRRKRA